MKILVISYSYTGNNETLAAAIAAELNAKHFRVFESKTRTMSTIFLDMLFNRTPQVNLLVEKIADYDLVIFMGPVWMGQVATPLRGYFKQLKSGINKYAFISISGGADGPNTKLGTELYNRIGKEPAALLDMHIADLLPAIPKPERKDTSAYHLTEEDGKMLSHKIVMILQESDLV